MFRTGSAHHVLRRLDAGLARPQRRGIVSETDVERARAYCLKQLQQGDYESYLIRRFIPRPAQDAYDALRTLNLELARLPEIVSTPLIGKLRMQFWCDAINNTFAGNPPREPICMLLHKAITDLAERTGEGRSGTGGANSMKFWVRRVITTRERQMDNRPFATLASLEEYAENTYATLMYATLASMPLRSVHVDHLASHVGKACGIIAVLRGIPVLAAPRPPQPIRSPAMDSGGSGGNRNPVLLLPLDVMAKAGLREEDVFRQGPHAEGLRDAVFEVATRAHDHLLTAREMLKNLRAGKDAGHDYEHEGESEHVYPEPPHGGDEQSRVDVQRGFGVLLEAVPAAEFLQRLEKVDFNPFEMRASWKLPWSIWKALQRREI